MRRQLTDAQVEEIRILADGGATARELAADFGVSHGTVSALVRGAIYADAPGPIREPRMPRGEEHSASQLTAEVVLDMRLMREEGHSFQVIADTYGCGKTTARKAVRGQTWSHLPDAVRKG